MALINQLTNANGLHTSYIQDKINTNKYQRLDIACIHVYIVKKTIIIMTVISGD